jgi:uncharacterized membrane protein HdeD (DUF308 family)
MAKKQSLSLSSPILYIILGALLVIFKAQMLSWAMTIAGIVFAALGIVDIVKGRTAGGAVNLIIGILILVLGNTLLNLVLIVLGVLIAVKGLVDLREVFKRKKRNALMLVFPIISIVVGIALAFGNLLGNLIVIIGVLLIADGILGLLGAKK